MTLKLTENAEKVLSSRYYLKDENGNVVEDAEMLFNRVAGAVAKADKKFGASKEDVKKTEKEFYELMTSLKFLPNSPTLMNAGTPIGQLSACFVLPVEDSMEGIFESVKNAALIHKSGGGTGFSFSRLRGEGARVASTGGEASGPISFMRVFNEATGVVAQAGKRRGANMGLLSVDHPDILKFIDCKNDLTQFTNFNISVGITDEFMKAVEAGTDYALYDPHTGEELERLDARDVFDKIATNAWKTGEPGIMFLDEVNRHNPVPNEGRIEATNPCGEQPLHAHSSCNLGSLNLTKFVKDGDIDWKAFEKAIKSAVHFLDNVIEVNKYPLKIIEKTTKKTRNIGLGIMGFADALFMLGIPYNTQEARDFGEKIMGFITDCGMEESKKLAKKRGTFPAYEGSVWERKNMPLRNATITTLAPTGSISVMAGCSSGMEPIFALAFTRNILDGAHLTEVNPILKEKLHEVGLDTDEMFERIAREGTLQNIEEIPDSIKKVFVCAPDISPRDHVLMQAAFQKRTHNAISKTVNLPNSATVDDVKEVYMTAYRTGCKGTTIYRDGSRDTQVLTTGTFDKKDEEDKQEEVRTEPMQVKPRPRPDSVYGVTEKMPVGCGNLYTTVNFDEQGICEIFTNTGKHGGCPSQSEATARLASLALRCGVAVEDIVAQLKGIRCPSTIRRPGMKCLSCPDAMARIIEREWEKEKDKMEQTIVLYDEESEVEEEAPASEPSENAICPDCGATLYHESGCVLCTECGYSKCG